MKFLTFISRRGLFLLAILLVSATNENIVEHSNVSTNWSVDPFNFNLFVKNEGQFNELNTKVGNEIIYAVEEPQMMAYFTKKGVTYKITEIVSGDEESEKAYKNYNEEEDDKPSVKEKYLTLEWLNANSDVYIQAEDKADAYFNYGTTDNNNVVNFVKAFRKITYKNLYDGIDLEYIFHPEGGLKYTLIVHPGANVNDIKFKYSGHKSLEFVNGEIKTHVLEEMGIIDHAPHTYYTNDQKNVIESNYKQIGASTFAFSIGSYDKTKELQIDPWTILSAPNNSKAYHIYKDGAGNSFVIGNLKKLVKYSPTGALIWVYTTPFPSNTYSGDIVADAAGNTYASIGCCTGRVIKISPAGTFIWTTTVSGSYEIWNLAINDCDNSQLVGTGYNSSTIFFVKINTATGAIIRTTNVSDSEVRGLCIAPNGNIYGLTCTFILGGGNYILGRTAGFGLIFYDSSYYNWTEPGPFYVDAGFGAQNAIVEDNCFLFTTNGAKVDKRDRQTGNFIATALIPGGVEESNSGIAVDSCGFVYVGSQSGIYKFDNNLVSVSNAVTPGPVYDLSLGNNGEVLATGNGFVSSIDMGACQKLPCSKRLLNINISSTDIGCDNPSGSATANVTGGTAPYSYLWSNGAVTQSINGLAAGVYTVTVSDSKCLIEKKSVTINSVEFLKVSAVSTNPSCFGASDGTATATAMGGKAPYTYLWSNGQLTRTAVNLAAGVYSCTVTDALGCEKSVSVTIIDPPLLNASFSINAAFCGKSNGSINVNASGGTPPLNYSFNGLPFTAQSNFPNLLGGNYPISIMDSKGCRLDTFAIVPISDGPSSLDLILNDDICSSSSGSIKITNVNGGSPAYTYSIDSVNFQSSNSFLNLTANSYFITVKDANNCLIDTSVSILNTIGIDAYTIRVDDASCNGSDGKITISNIVNGTSPYQYSLNGGTFQSSNVFNNLVSGSYQLSVKDANGCLKDSVANVASLMGISNIDVVLGDEYCDLNNGSAKVEKVYGGATPYTYSLDNISFQASNTFSMLDSGTYRLFVKDANNCMFSKNVRINAFPPISDFGINSSPENCNLMDGELSVSNIVGGTTPFQYQIDASAFQNTPLFTNLMAGTYTITVKDIYDCRLSKSITITTAQGPSFVDIITTQTACSMASGSIVLNNIIGGNPAFTYQLDAGPVQNNNAFYNVSAGMHAISIMDANGCKLDTNALITTANKPSATQQTTNVSCFNGNDGSIAVSVSGGETPYSYAWNTVPIQTTATAVNLTANTYTCTVTDKNGCTVSIQSTVTESTDITVSLATTKSSCTVNDGTATATVSGGSGNYTYSWSTTPVQTTATATGLAPGNYSLTVTDQLGCVKVISPISISSVNAPNVGLTNFTPVSCYNGSDGAIFTQTTGGKAPYSFAWNTSPIQNTANASNLAPGTYTLTVTDALGCVGSYTHTLSNPSDITATFTSSNEFCNSANANILTTAIGGTGVLQYSWNSNPIQSTKDLIGVSAGSYQLTITDQNNCSKTFSQSVVNIPGPTLNSITKNDVNCKGGSDGSIIINATGNTALTYTWQNYPNQNTNSLYNLKEGTYTCRVSDNNACYIDVPIVLGFVNPIPVFNLGKDTAFCESDSIEIGTTAMASIYKWNTGQNTPNIFVKKGGEYRLTITRNGCSYEDTIFVREDLKPLFDLGPDKEICEGDSALITSANASYLNTWNTGATTSSIYVKQAGNYFVDVENKRCRVRDSIYVTSIPLPQFTLGNDTSICAGDSTTIGVSMQGASYLWNTGESKPYINAKNDEVYSLSITVNKCTSKRYKNLDLLPLPSFKIPNLKLCPLDSLLLDIRSYSLACVACEFLWENGDTVPTQLIYEPSEKTIRMTDVYGCTSLSAINISRDYNDECDPGIYVPSSFTPNGDGVNETFVPVFRKDVIDKYAFTIFNRWGEVVFSSSVIGEAWDGLYRLKDSKPDVYTWKLEYSYVYSKQLEVIYGKVTLLR